MVGDERHIDDWIPSTDADRSEVLAQLDRILSSPLFRNSKRYPAMLRHVVEQTLAGNEALLKERLLGINVFHRPPDYDTNQDTIVRLTAGEVRKRIAQYYHQQEHLDQLQIDLRAGSYVPVFRRPGYRLAPASRATSQASAEEPPRTDDHAEPQPSASSGSAFGPVSSVTVHPPPLATPEAPTPPPAIQPAPSSRPLHPWARRSLAFAVSLVLVAGAQQWWSARQAANSPERRLWAPILREPGPVLLVLADLSAGLDQNPQAAKRTGELADLLRMGELVNYRDSLAQSGIVAFLSQHNKPYTLELSSHASYPDLQRGASVLIGGLDNLWTMRLTEPLRFHFLRRGTTYTFAIEDRQHPETGGWSVDLSQPVDLAQPPGHDREDYALVARVFDQTTGRPVLVVAGLGANGTAAAVRFLLDPTRTAELVAHAPPNWDRLNMEAVLRTQILDNHAGPPTLVASTFW
jgi:hypothetical protein